MTSHGFPIYLITIWCADVSADEPVLCASFFQPSSWEVPQTQISYCRSHETCFRGLGNFCSCLVAIFAFLWSCPTGDGPSYPPIYFMVQGNHVLLLNYINTISRNFDFINLVLVLSDTCFIFLCIDLVCCLLVGTELAKSVLSGDLSISSIWERYIRGLCCKFLVQHFGYYQVEEIVCNKTTETYESLCYDIGFLAFICSASQVSK